jgi:hypothetical protein
MKDLTKTYGTQRNCSCWQKLIKRTCKSEQVHALIFNSDLQALPIALIFNSDLQALPIALIFNSDLQALPIALRGEAGSLFYVRKLAI